MENSTIEEENLTTISTLDERRTSTMFFYDKSNFAVPTFAEETFARREGWFNAQ